MPRCPEHLAFAAPCSLITYMACSPPGFKTTGGELLGLIAGWYLGARAADLIDTPSSPMHRDIAHSGVAILALSKTHPIDWVTDCRKRASELQALARSANTEQERAGCEFRAFLWQIVAGFIPAVLGAYGSHLLLDATTRKGLPAPWIAVLGLLPEEAGKDTAARPSPALLASA